MLWSHVRKMTPEDAVRWAQLCGLYLLDELYRKGEALEEEVTDFIGDLLVHIGGNLSDAPPEALPGILYGIAEYYDTYPILLHPVMSAFLLEAALGNVVGEAMRLEKEFYAIAKETLDEDAATAYGVWQVVLAARIVEQGAAPVTEQALANLFGSEGDGAE